VNVLGHDFPFLALPLRGDEFAVDGDRGAGAGAGHGGVVGQGGVDDDLDALEAGAVVQFDEGEGFGVAAGADPTLKEDGVEGGGAGESVFDESAVHGIFAERLSFPRAGEARQFAAGFAKGAVAPRRSLIQYARMRISSSLSAITCWLVLGLVGTAPAFAAKGTIEERQAATRAMRDEVLAELYKRDASLRQKINKAEGYAVFSNVGLNLIFASVAGGKGLVVNRGGKEVFMKMASGGLGLGLGIKDFRAVFVFKSKQKLEQFIEKGFDFGAQADAAAQSGDKGRAGGGR